MSQDARGQEVSRRRFLQLGVSGLAALGVPAHKPRPRGAEPDGRRQPSRAEWAALRDRLTGRLSTPGNPRYDVDRELYDPRFDGVRPAAIAFCANAADVARSISFARAHDLALAARSGGHSYGGYSTTTGLVVDVSLMSRVSSSGSKGERATVGAGARLIDVYSGLARGGVSIPAGSCPTVGVAGLALGGGIGVMARLHGLTCDNVAGVEIVTAAGEVLQADAGTNSDLYWACRGGGGGNFGVVTQFRFTTFPTADVCLFSATWPWEAAGQLVEAWLDWAPGAPDELWSNCILEADPGAGQPWAHVGGVWAGAAAGAQSQLARLVRAVGPSSSQSVGQNDFEDAMYIEAGCEGLSQVACHLGGKYPGGMLPRSEAVAKSDILERPLGEAGVKALLAGVEERQQQGGPGGVVIDSWGGAVNRVARGATAFVHRDALASAQYIAEFPAGAPTGALRAARAWMGAWYTTLRPYVSGEAYQNYLDPSLPRWAEAYYGANLPRLRQVKARWDPDDVFRFAQSIPLPS